MSDFLVASSKPWHRETFDHVAAGSSFDWSYVSTPEQLSLRLETARPLFIFFLHWSWIVPKSIWQEYECVCFHMTDVPYGRGGSPLQNLILRGHKSTKVTALRMTSEIDAGPVYKKEDMELQGSAEQIYRRAGELCWQMIQWIIDERPVPTPQEGHPVFFERRNPSESELLEADDINQLYDFIRMLDAPTYPAAYIDHKGWRVSFRDACLTSDQLEARVIIRKIEDRGCDD